VLFFQYLDYFARILWTTRRRIFNILSAAFPIPPYVVYEDTTAEEQDADLALYLTAEAKRVAEARRNANPSSFLIMTPIAEETKSQVNYMQRIVALCNDN
jgi:hypothetical protein